MSIRNIILSLFSASLFFILIGHTVAAMEEKDYQNYRTYLSDINIDMSAYMTTKVFAFHVEDYWNATELQVNLDYQATPILNYDNSSITLKLNGTSFHTFRPLADEHEKQHITLDVPLELLVYGTNSLMIEVNMAANIENNVCIEINKGDNWLELYNTSNINLIYSSEAQDGSIQNFNKQFTGLDTISAGQAAIAVSEEADPSELEAAVYALSGYAKSNKLNDKPIPLIPYGQRALLGKNSVVLVALYDHLSNDVREHLDQFDTDNEAIIQVITVDAKSFLVITSQNSELLVKAGRLMLNEEIVRQLNGNKKIINNGTNVDTTPVETNVSMTLTETGDLLIGSEHQAHTYYISLPANRTIADASKISLDFRYAKNLNFNRSMVTILVNGTPIGSKRLMMESADGDQLTLAVPKNIGVNGNFSVTVAFDLELVDPSCFPHNFEMPWAYITQDTVMQLNTKDGTDLLFNNYPSPFLRDGNYNLVAVILPDSRDQNTYLTVSNLFNLLGKYAEGNTGDVRIYTDDLDDASLNKKNIIAIGTYKNNAFIRENNDNLYFQFDPDGLGFISNEKMSIDVDYGETIGSLQLIDSPYESGHGFLAVTGSSSEQYYLASKLLSNESLKWQVFGDAMMTDKDGNIKGFRFKKKLISNQDSLIDRVIERKDVIGFIGISAIVLVFLLLNSTLMILKYRKKRRSDNEN